MSPPQWDGLQSKLALWLAFLFSAMLHGGVVGLILFLGLGGRPLELQDLRPPPTFNAVGLYVKPPPEKEEEA
ncbi:MAG: hypothetical protein ACE5KM_10950, partial [Planctomycetaceae bacterium]